MVIVFQILIALILIAALTQILKIIKPTNSKITLGWLASASLIVLASEFLLYNFIDNKAEQATFLGLLTISLLANFIKFSLGYIQKKELTLYNRFEHLIAGAMLFYLANLINLIQILGSQGASKLGSGLIMVAFVNLGSVIFEVSELVVDKIKGKKYLVGPGVNDTGFDLLMILLGSVLGLTVYLLL